MGKQRKCAPAAMDEFRPLYRKDGLIWVPYRSGDTWHLHYLTPETVLQGVCYALPLVTGGGKIIPFALGSLRGNQNGK